ncbi:MAG: hypothetical protein WCG20_00380 [bacterium]
MLKKITSFVELYRTQDNVREFNEVREERKSLFFCAGLLYRINQSGEYEVLIIDYRADGVGEVQIKFPGGRSSLGETPKDTLWNSLRREVAYKYQSRKLRIVFYDTWFKKGSKEDIDHVKIFFSEEVPFSRSYFFSEIQKSDYSETTNPRWEKISRKLIESVFYTHQRPLMCLAKFLNITL